MSDNKRDWDDETAREQGNAGEDTKDDRSPDYGKDEE